MDAKNTKKCIEIINTKFRLVVNFWGLTGNIIGKRFLGASVMLVLLYLLDWVVGTSVFIITLLCFFGSISKLMQDIF